MSTQLKIRKSYSLKDVFHMWLDQKGSKKTIATYNRVVPQFFEYMFEKEIAEITKEDMEDILPITVRDKYINRLIEERVSQGTVKNYLAIVASFVNYISINNVFEGINYQKISKVSLKSSNLKDDSQRTTSMPEEEYEKFKSWLENRKFAKRYGNLEERYSLALEMMYGTGMRIDAIFNNLKWSGITRETDTMGNEVWIIRAIDKGDKINESPIDDDFYQRIVDVFYTEDTKSDDLVLGSSISSQSFTRLMNEYSKESGFKVTPHSIRVGAGTKVYKLTKDIVLTSRFLNHSNTQTTELYIRTDDDKTNTGSYIMTSTINKEDISKLTHDQLLEILDSREDLSRSVLLHAYKTGMI